MSTPYPISRQYRTKLSINDAAVAAIKAYVERYQPKTFVDFGTHLGHLALELALSYDITVYAVDAFKLTGYFSDGMGIPDYETGDSGSFLPAVIRMIEQHKDACRGRIYVMIDVEFFTHIEPGAGLGMAFIDNSHKAEHVWQFRAVADRIKVGGIIGGHDWSTRPAPGVLDGIESLTNNDCRLLEHRPHPCWFLEKIK